MKIHLTILLTLLSFSVFAAKDTASNTRMTSAAYTAHSWTATAALGFIDVYRHDYTLPPAFEKNSTSGFVPFYAKLEYGVSDHVSLAATFIYDAFVYNFNQIYKGNNGTVLRYKTNNTRIISGGLAAYYHFTHLFHSPRVDPFIAVGVAINNIRYSAFPEGDSTLVRLEHTITPMIKAGARYYINDVFSIYGDAGFDKQCIFSLGFSCRFPKSKKVYLQTTNK